MNKRSKWTNKRSRILDALESNAHDNQYESMISNLSLLTMQEFLSNKDRILFIALKNASRECSEFLLSKEARFNSLQILTKCEWNKMSDVFNLLEELTHKYEYLEASKDAGTGLQKSYLINRLIDPSKVDANRERVDYLFKLVSEGFFTAEQVKEQIEVNYKDKPEKKNRFVSIYRELALKELGI